MDVNRPRPTGSRSRPRDRKTGKRDRASPRLERGIGEKSLTDEASSQGTGDASGVRAAEAEDGKMLDPTAVEEQLKKDIVDKLRVMGERDTKLTRSPS